MTLRITGGILGGRHLRVPEVAVRPTQDRVRAAIFSALGTRVDGARVLDLFAGSGALGLEACSRGAAQVVWVESRRQVWRVINDNIRTLTGAEPARRLMPTAPLVCVCDDVEKFLKGIVRAVGDTGQFDLVFADPPYEFAGELLKKLLPELTREGVLHPDACLVFEHAAALKPASYPPWELRRSKHYGETGVSFYQRNA